MRREVLSVALGTIAALLIVSFTINLQRPTMMTASAPRLAGKADQMEVNVVKDEGPQQNLSYLILPFSLFTAVLVYGTANRILHKEEVASAAHADSCPSTGFSLPYVVSSEIP